MLLLNFLLHYPFSIAFLIVKSAALCGKVAKNSFLSQAGAAALFVDLGIPLTLSKRAGAFSIFGTAAAAVLCDVGIHVLFVI